MPLTEKVFDCLCAPFFLEITLGEHKPSLSLSVYASKNFSLDSFYCVTYTVEQESMNQCE